MNSRNAYFTATFACSLLFFAFGCRSVQPAKPIPASAFYQQSPGSTTPTPGRDASDRPSPATGPATGPTTAAGANHSMPSAPPGVNRAAATTTASRPATMPDINPGETFGKYLTLGAVLAEVNGKAVYADEVFSHIDKALHAKAMELDEQGYQVAAQQLIQQEITTQISNELAYSAAQRALSQQDKMTADAATERWRQKQITDAGGSLQLARLKAQAQGEDFDRMVERQGRRFLIELYRQKKIYPRVQVTVQDMRRYYNRNASTLYTEHAAARFLLIKTDPQRSGGREAALKKMQEIRRRVLAGEDFGKLAHDMSDDSLLRNKNGDVGWVDQGAYRLDAVEKAAWALHPGEVSDIIDTDGAFYLVKLVALKRGRTIPFENEQVQEQINQTLRLAQVRQLVDEAEQELRANAAVWQNPQAASVTMEMAMQKYAQWRGQH